MTAPLFEQRALGVARIALPVPIDSLFDYAIPEALADRVVRGGRVLVDFSGQKLSGVVLELDPLPEQGPAGLGASGARAGVDVGLGDPADLSRILQVLDAEPVISGPFLGVLQAAAAECLCPIGLALASALPPGAGPRAVSVLGPTARGRDALASGAVQGVARAVLEALARSPSGQAALSRRVEGASAALEDLLRDGLVVRQHRLEGAGPSTQGERVATVAPGLDLEEICSQALRRAPRQAALLRKLAELGTLPTRLVAERAGGTAAQLRSLADRGLVRIERRRVAGRLVAGLDDGTEGPPILTEEQEAALGPITEGIAARRAQTFLLHGVTGSGKTEVYLRAVETALEAGRQALLLVPEITLTHQIVARLRARFGDQLAILHSGLKPSERVQQWHRLKEGETPIAVGARSALFAPLDDIGVIVIDEEHDSAYKNQEGFRYHARTLAARRAETAGCPLILGSATPALETRHRADTGEITRLVLERRVAGRPLPSVELVDLAKERRKTARGRKLILSKLLRRALAETLDDGAQSILFLNRRGFSTQIFCFDCGFAERCGACDVALVYHAAEHCLRCHYCDFAKPPPEHCGGCGQPDTALLGTGTERLEEEVRSLFPNARLARLDRDIAQRRGHVEGVLAGISSGDVDVLIGTQMVAKGHDFPGVRLVGVIAADLGLHMPDFRAAERTFQLLTQVAGRAGRAATPGRVIVQSFVCDHYAIQPVTAHDYETFYRAELKHRAELGYPPFGRLTNVTISGEEQEATRKAAEALAAAARSAPGAAACEILGPAPAALPRLRGRYRYQLLVKGRQASAVRDVSVRLDAAARKLGRSASAVVDVDPINML